MNYKGVIILKRFVKSMFIGASYVIPGVCSSTTALSLGEYQNILELSSGFYRYKIIKKHIKLIIGILIGVIFTLCLLSVLAENFTPIIMAVFLGINIALFKNDFFELKNIVFKLLGMIFVLILSLKFNIYMNNNTVSYAISGILVGLGFVLPGLSGSLLMVGMGIYQLILNYFNDFIRGNFFININFLIFLIFLFIGIIVWSKIFLKLLINKNVKFDAFVKGMSISSIVLLAKETFCSIDKIIFVFLIFILVIFIIFISKTLIKFSEDTV